MFWNKSRALAEFWGVIKRTQMSKDSRDKEWNSFIDKIYEDGFISKEQATTWINPFRSIEDENN